MSPEGSGTAQIVINLTEHDQQTEVAEKNRLIPRESPEITVQRISNSTQCLPSKKRKLQDITTEPLRRSTRAKAQPKIKNVFVKFIDNLLNHDTKR